MSPTTHPSRSSSGVALELAAMLERLGHPVDPAVHHRISLESAAKGGAALGGGPAFKADPRTSKLLNRAISDPGHTLLFGPPGTGKSTAARYAFEQAGVPYVRISCHPGMDADEFIGTVEAKVSPEGRQLFEAKWGPMVVAAEQGTGIILEEVNALLPERSFALFSLLDDSRNFLAQVCGSERWIEKHPGFKVIGTANDNGTGEHMAMYAGIQVMNSALRDRFSRQICIPYLTEPEEVGMLMERTGISESKAKLMVALASETRSRAAKGEGVDAISPRSLIAWAQSCVGSVSHGDNLTWWDTAEITIANRQESHNRVVLQKMVTDRFTGDVIRM